MDSISEENEGIYIENIKRALVKSINTLKDTKMDKLKLGKFTWYGIVSNINELLFSV